MERSRSRPLIRRDPDLVILDVKLLDIAMIDGAMHRVRSTVIPRKRVGDKANNRGSCALPYCLARRRKDTFVLLFARSPPRTCTAETRLVIGGAVRYPIT